MIKGISFLRPTGNAAAYERLASFFSALGFASGKGWNEETTPRRGLSGSAGQSGIRRWPVSADRRCAGGGDGPGRRLSGRSEDWLRDEGGEEAVARLSAISETHWKSSLFYRRAGIRIFRFHFGLGPIR